MEQYKLGEMEQRFAELIWENAPIASGQLARLCETVFNSNETGVVTVVMPREEFQGAQGEQFVNENFNGSLPQFLLAFSRRKKLSDKEVAQLKKMIEEYEEGKEL